MYALAPLRSSAAQKIRPVAGIGVLVFPPYSIMNEELFLYEEPGLKRIASFNPVPVPAFEWIFGDVQSPVQLIVTARRQEWIKVVYDEAGREGWLNPKGEGDFVPYADWLRHTIVHLLPGLHKKYYQLLRSEEGSALGVLTPKDQLKIVKTKDEWAQVLTAQNQIGWLRWKDEDGRLLVGCAARKGGSRP